ncbi:MAG: CpaE family protein [Sphingomonadales bacterium]
MSVSALRSLGAKTGGDREPFAAFILDDATRECLTPIASDQGWKSERIQSGGIANAVRSLAVTAPPHILVVDLSQSQEPRADITALAEVCEPGTIVIALGEVNDVALYRDLVAAGIFDYLVKPVSLDQMRGVIAAAKELEQDAPSAQIVPPTSGKLVPIIGVRGGAGASTVAINTAWFMSTDHDQKTALVDIDIHFGTAALVFDLEPNRGLFDALENPGRVDGLFIERAMVRKSANFSILSGEAPLADTLDPNPAALNHLLDELKKNFATVLLDLPRGLIGFQQFVLTKSDHIVLVADLSLVSVRDTIRMLGFAKDVAPETPITVVANRVRGGVRDEVSQRDFENAIERQIDLVVPDDPKTAMLAAKTAKTFPEAGPASKATRAIRELTRGLLGVEEASNKGSFWQRLKAGG